MIAAISVAAIIVGLFFVWAFGPVQAGTRDTRQFVVQPGWGGGRIASELQHAGLIRWAPAFIIYSAWTHTGDRLQAGTYALSRGMTTAEIERIIAGGAGLSTDITLTIPEGMNVWEIDELLTAKHLIVSGSFARTWSKEEGTLFPDTYRLSVDIARASGSYQNAGTIGRVFLQAFGAAAARYSPQQVVVASILEKEAKSADDMSLVAGIIDRRLELGIPLQMDATVAYGWCLARWLPMNSNRNCDVTQAPIAAEIKVDGPYNTYIRKGLPAGPISNPGLQALNAAAHPTSSPYLYYLSTRDGSQLIYAKTLDEHLTNRLKYLGF